MTKWEMCPASRKRAHRDRCRYSGLRKPESGATVNQFLEWFPEVKEWQVAAVLNHEAEHLKALART